MQTIQQTHPDTVEQPQSPDQGVIGYVVVFDTKHARVLFVRRDDGALSLPGDYPRHGESTADAAVRALYAETRIEARVTELERVGRYDRSDWGRHGPVDAADVYMAVVSTEVMDQAARAFGRKILRLQTDNWYESTRMVVGHFKIVEDALYGHYYDIGYYHGH